ncbi:NDP-sugar synthase [Candidatus Fermentibacterales bacterium]|nr:NDP-sugar synthase [Candidatus Fermentibacterales bacterium]
MQRLEGVLLLTAGHGRRAEPLSFSRPKALLPAPGGMTLLGRLACATASLRPSRIVVNASRCRRMISDAMLQAGVDRFELAFEERPLGVVGTLRRLARGMERGAGGAWMVVNTDMVTDLDPEMLLAHHLDSGRDWTAAAGPMPQGGSFSPLLVAEGRFGRPGGDRELHYLGISVLGPEVLELCVGCHGEMFRDLAPLVLAAGLETGVFVTSCAWSDMGNPEAFRSGILSAGGFVSPSAVLEEGAVLEGVNYIGAGCRVCRGSVVRDCVLLDGSCVEGAVVAETVVAWGTTLKGD